MRKTSGLKLKWINIDTTHRNEKLFVEKCHG